MFRRLWFVVQLLALATVLVVGLVLTFILPSSDQDCDL